MSEIINPSLDNISAECDEAVVKVRWIIVNLYQMGTQGFKSHTVGLPTGL